jgi:soluble lytic murein transglycosylase
MRLRASAAACVAALLAIAAALVAASARADEQEPSAAALEALSKAFAAQDAKDWASAKTLSENQPAVVRDLVQWRYVSSDVSSASFDEIDAFVTAHTNWPGRFQIIQRGEETLLTNALVDAKGPAWFKAHPPRTSGGCLAWAKFQFAHDQKP